MCVQGNAGQTSTALPLDEEEEEEEAASGTIPFTVGYNSRGNQNKARQVDTDIVIGMNQERRQASAMAIGVGVGVGVKGGVASAAADGMLAGPASKDNGGSMDCTPQGLMAYGAGSSVVVVDTRSMQLVTVLPMPPHGAEAGTGAGAGAGASSSSSSSSSGSGAGVGSQGPLHPASFVTAVRFSPQGAARWPAQEHKAVVLAVGDRQGRIAIWDVTARAVTEWLTGQGQGQRQGVQELCWFNHGGRSLIVVVHGASLLSAWNVNVSGQGSRCVWRYDASPEVLACVRADPFDSRHACVVGVRGALLSLTVTGDGDSDIILRQFELQTSEVEGSLKGEKDAGSASQASPSPAMVLFPNSSFKCRFSLKWPNIVFIMFPREFIVFDLQYGAVLSVTSLPWGYSKLLDVIVDIEGVILCCVHVDGKLSMWKRKEGKQVYVLCTMQALMPSLGTSVPSPAILSVSHCSSEFEIEKVGKICSKESHGVEPFTSCAISDYNSSSLLSVPVTNTTFISISDDGKVWKWLLTAEMPMHVHDNGLAPILSSSINAESGIESTAVSIQGLAGSEADESKVPKLSQNDEIITKIKLVSQLHLLPAAVTTLAVPSPSLIATLPGGGNDPAVAVPLVALATQAGSIEVVDVAATAIVASFSVHSSAIRGLRWLGNSKLVSFSFSEANDRGGGYVNRLAVTCVRSGLSRFFRVTQKLEKAPMRAIRASPSGRYLIILFREAPAEIWAMTRDPQMLRSLALPFSVVEWALPPVPKPQQKSISRQSSFFSKARPTIASTAAAASVQSSSDTKADSPVEQPEEMGESFAFALVNGSVGVFEVRGRRVKDFRPKWPPSSFISSDVLITAMAYRMPHVVMGDRHGNIRWWDVKTGLSSSFNTYRGSIRRIKFAPVVAGDHSRGRVAVLFTDNTFSIYDLDTQDPLANAILQPHFAGILVLELDWFPLRLDKKEPLLLCISGADSSFRLLEVTPQASKSIQTNDVQAVKSRFQPMSFCSTSLLPAPHALAFRMLLQWGVKEFWFNVENDPSGRAHYNTNGKTSTMEKMDYRNYILQTSLPQIGDNVAVELLLKILEPYRNAGQLLDKQRAKMYSSLLNKGCTARFAFAAALFGEHSEATFWLQLPHVLSQLIRCVDMKFTEDTNAPKVSSKPSHSDSSHSFKSVGEEASRRTSQGSGFSALENLESCLHSLGMPGEVVPSDKQSLCANARERISWHENIGGEDALQKHIHELISVGDLESAVNLSLSTPPESPYFYADALRAVALSSAVSQALHELAVKVVAANMVSTDKSLSGTHLLCAVGRYQEACSQLQDAGYWTDAATLAATHLKGSDYSRVLQRWAYHVLHNERNIWRALILFVAAGLLHEALAVLRDSREPNTAVMFLLSCHEIKSKNMTEIDGSVNTESPELNCQGDSTSLDLPGDLNQHKEDVLAVCEFYGQYQRDLVHLCTELAPVAD